MNKKVLKLRGRSHEEKKKLLAWSKRPRLLTFGLLIDFLVWAVFILGAFSLPLAFKILVPPFAAGVLFLDWNCWRLKLWALLPRAGIAVIMLGLFAAGLLIPQLGKAREVLVYLGGGYGLAPIASLALIPGCILAYAQQQKRQALLSKKMTGESGRGSSE